MAKPTIITRAGKGSALTWTEGDANLTNLRDATLTVSDGTTSKALNLNDTLTFTAGTNVTLSVNGTTGAVTINSAQAALVSGTNIKTVNGTTLLGSGDLGTIGLGYGGTGKTSAPAAMANLIGFTTTATAAGTTTLTSSSSYYQVFTGSTTQTVVLPATSTLATGWSYHIVNNSSGALTLQTATPTTITTIPAGVTCMATCISTAGDTTAAWETGFTDFSTLTGTGNVVLATSPTLTTPTIGVATATSVNKVAITAPATSATLTIADGKTLTASNTLTFTGTDSSSVAFGTGGTVLYSGGALGTPSSGTVTNLTGTASININGTVGATTANTGAFTTISASTTTTSNAVNVTYNPSTASGSALFATGGNTQGGSGYFDFLKVTSTATGITNANKTFRMTSTGTIEIVDSGYTNVRLSLTDAGVLTATSIVSSGSLTFKDTREAIYDLGTTGGTVAPNPANGSVQKITLNAALTINAFTSPVAGQSLTLIIYGGTAYTSITSTMKFAGGIKTLTGTAGCIDILTVYYDGTNYFASLGKGFA